MAWIISHAPSGWRALNEGGYPCWTNNTEIQSNSTDREIRVNTIDNTNIYKLKLSVHSPCR